MNGFIIKLLYGTVRGTEREKKLWVNRLEIVCKFFTGFNMDGKWIVSYAVVTFDQSDTKNAALLRWRPVNGRSVWKHPVNRKASVNTCIIIFKAERIEKTTLLKQKTCS